MCACVLVGVALPKVRGVIRTGGRRCAYGTMALWHYGTVAPPSRVSHGSPTNQIETDVQHGLASKENTNKAGM